MQNKQKCHYWAVDYTGPFWMVFKYTPKIKKLTSLSTTSAGYAFSIHN